MRPPPLPYRRQRGNDPSGARQAGTGYSSLRKKKEYINSISERKPVTKIVVDERLDLRGEICPYNFVRTKLKLEEMASGQVLEVILDKGRPMKDVPRSLKEEGHHILKVRKVGKAFKLIIKKG